MLLQPLHSHPAALPAPSAPAPRRILDMNYAFASTAILVAAVRLRLFTHMAQHALAPAALAELARRMPGAMERLLKGLEGLEGQGPGKKEVTT